MKIEIIKRFLSLLDAQMMFIRIVEKQQCSQYRTFTDTLSSREMHIPIYGNLCIRNIGTIDKDYLIQVFHLRLLFELYPLIPRHNGRPK